MKPLPHSLLLCLLPNKGNGPWQAELHPTSHAYQLCQTANGRADWTAGDLYKRSPSNQREAVHLERSNCQQHTEREAWQDRRHDCPATMPCGPGTPPLIRGIQQQPIRTSRSRLNSTADLRPINRVTSGSSSPAAYRRPRHDMATQPYIAVNTTQQQTTNNGK